MKNSTHRWTIRALAAFALGALVGTVGCGPVMPRGQSLFATSPGIGGPGPAMAGIADLGMTSPLAMTANYAPTDGPYFEEDPASYDCFECGPGHPGPVRGLIHDLFHHRGPVIRAVDHAIDFILCEFCGGNANACGCHGAAPASCATGACQHNHGQPGLFGNRPIPVANHVGPCWGYYETAWRRFPDHCPNVPGPLPYGPDDGLPMLEEIGPGSLNGAPQGGPQGDPSNSGPQILPAPINGDDADGFRAVDNGREPEWQTASDANPLRQSGGNEPRTAWKPGRTMTWLPIRTAGDERHWRKPTGEQGTLRSP